MKASVTIHVETLWTNRAELTVEAELDNAHSGTNQEVISLMFEAARLDERDKRLTAREETVAVRDDVADERESAANTRERDQMEREVRSQQA